MNLEPVLFATVGPRQALAPVVFLLVMMPLFGLYPAVEAALVTTTGGWTRILTLASGAHGEISGGVFDAEFTSDAAYAVLIGAS
mgnify:CR=1 FL=1